MSKTTIETFGYSASPSEARSSRIAALIAEARSHSARGDVVLCEEAIRTLDDMMGHWVDGKFVGGKSLVFGAQS